MSDAIDQNDLKRRMDGAVANFKKALAGLRTGRASATLLEPVTVDAYGQRMPINQLATVSAPEPRLIMVNVWDKSMTGPVEKGIREANLGLNPIVDGQNLRIPLPDMTEERRKELAKTASGYAEDAKVAVRHVRRDGMDALKKAVKDKQIGEDESRNEGETVQKRTDDTIREIDELLKQKEAEIMQV